MEKANENVINLLIFSLFILKKMISPPSKVERPASKDMISAYITGTIKASLI